jgi:hypothetical protein
MKAISRLVVVGGWQKIGDFYYADISDISGHQKSTGQAIKCPKCRVKVPSILKILTPERNMQENEIEQWKGRCPFCKAPLVIHND